MISIIIVNYKVVEEVISCITSILNSRTKVNYEIIVVDNDEENTIGQDLKKQFPKLRYIKSSKNIGFGAGCNLGEKLAKREYLFFLNPDTELLPDTLDELCKFIVNKKNAGAVSPLLIDKNKKVHKVIGSQFPTPIRVVFSLSFIHKLFPNNFIARKFFLKDWSARQIDVFPGSAFLIKKDVFEKANKFDENYFLFYEEADLARKIFDLGYKNYIVPNAKLIHLGGKSTKTRKDIKEILQKSQFYYFKKWYGIIPAIFVKVVTSFDKYHLVIFLILGIALFLRFYKVDEYMTFIGDQGWFYLSARDMLLTGKIPLVGITASHTWLHQGPYWTYILAIIFKLFNFNPIAPAYFTAILGTITVFLFYKILKEIQSRNAGLIAALIYATSPLVILNDRLAYHTSLIPFFSLLFIYFFYKWLNGRTIFFPLIIFILSFLYNLELFTVVLWIVFILFGSYGLIKKEVWIKKINKKIILLSFISLIIPMLPILIYDTSHGFRQTIIFSGWVFYKSITFVGSNHLGNIFQLIKYLWLNYQKLIYPLSSQVSLILLLGSLGYLFYSLKRKSYFNYFIAFAFIVLIFGVVINKTSSEAYLPAFFPFLIIISSIFFTKLISIKSINFIVFSLFLIIVGFNSMYLVATNFFSNNNFSFIKRIESADRIINIVKNQKYNILGRGEGSQFESFTMNYEYLLWWKGHPPSKEIARIKIIISESPSGIAIEKKE